MGRSDGCPLEDQITDVVVGMAVAGEQLHRRWIAANADVSLVSLW
jgi:hypothetical protein